MSAQALLCELMDACWQCGAMDVATLHVRALEVPAPFGRPTSEGEEQRCREWLWKVQSHYIRALTHAWSVPVFCVRDRAGLGCRSRVSVDSPFAQ